jgi:hypothetical protein
MSSRNLVRLASIVILGLALGTALPSTGWTWGGTGHHYIAQNYSKHLPAECAALSDYDATVDAHVTDPDTRKGYTDGEAEKHYLDIDYYPEFPAGTFPRSRSVLESRYGAATVTDHGVLPWAIADAVTTLTGQFRAGQWDAAALTIADLCHYAGDLNQPLHCTQNYDGQLTGNGGIHSRYESDLVEAYQAQLSTSPMAAVHYGSPLDAAFDLLTCSWNKVAPILLADNTARATSGGTYNATYYASLWGNLRTLTQARLDTASVMTASLVYTAWVDAGRPAVGAATTVFLSAGPSPFDDHLNLRFNIPGPASVDVYDVRGARVAHVKDGLAGEDGFTWRPADTGTSLEAGIYFVRMDAPGHRLVKKVMFCPRPRPYTR